MLKKYKLVKTLEESHHAIFQLMQKENKQYIMKKVPLPKPRENLNKEIQEFRRVGELLKKRKIGSVLPLADIFVSERNIYALREYVPGQSTQQVMNTRKDTWMANDLSLIKSLLKGLGNMHQLNITHREINPKNIFIVKNQQACIDSLGITRIVEGYDSHNNYYLRYTPQEIINQQPSINYAISDVYSMGATIYHFLHNAPPFSSEVDQQLIAKICQEPYKKPKLHTTKKELFSKILYQTLNKEPESRIQNGKQFYDLFQHLETPEAKKFIRISEASKIVGVILAMCITFYIESTFDDMKKKREERNKPILTEEEKAHEETIRKYRRKVLLGNDNNAMKSIADIYRYGKGTKVNDNAAFTWYQRSAKLGNIYAMNSLGTMYLYGKGVNKNTTLALKWYQIAQKRKNPDAYASIGNMYEKGYYFQKNYEKAFELYEQGEAKNSSQALVYLGKLFEEGKISKTKSKYNIASYYEKASQLNNFDGTAHLGRMYEQGIDKQKDIPSAVHYYKRAASEGNALGLFYLARCYEKGTGVLKDTSKAHEYYTKAYQIGLDAQEYTQAKEGANRTQ